MTNIYESLLSEVTDDLCKKVLAVYLEFPCIPITRREMVMRVYGAVVKGGISESTKDRKIRMARAKLVESGFPIISDPSTSGSWFELNEREIRRRALRIQEQGETIVVASKYLLATIPKSRRIAEALKTGEVYEQERLLA